MVSYLLLTNSFINLSFQFSSFEGLCNALAKIFKINFVKQGDRSKVSNLNNDMTFAGSCDSITKFNNFSKFDNFFSMVGFIIVLFPIYSSFICDKWYSQHISVYLFLS